MKINFQPIYKIENTFVRRLLTVMVFTLTGFIALFIAMPTAAFVDAAIGAIKHIYWAVKSLVWDLPKNLSYVNKELYKTYKTGLKVGWYG
jgi:hypothetical protein